MASFAGSRGGGEGKGGPRGGAGDGTGDGSEHVGDSSGSEGPATSASLPQNVLLATFVAQAIPFIGFGFMVNPKP